MARKAQLRWTKTDIERLKREIANYNKRVRRARKKYPNIKMPETVRYTEIKPKITTRSELNKELRVLRGATAKSLAPVKGKDITEYQLKVDRANKAAAKRERRNRLLSMADLSPRLGRFPDTKDMLVSSLKAQAGETMVDKLEGWLQGNNLNKSIKWKENYLQTIKDNIMWSTMQGDDLAVEELTELFNKIQSMELQDFLIGQIVSGNQLGIGYLLNSPNTMIKEDYDKNYGRAQRLNEVWSTYATS